MSTYAQRVSAFIEGQGHATTLESPDDGNVTYIRFRTRGRGFTAVTNEADTGFILITTAERFPAPLEADAATYAILLAIQDRLKCVKLAFSEDRRSVIVNVELFFDGEDGYQPTFWRSVSVLETAVYDAARDVQKNAEVKLAADRFVDDVLRGNDR